MFLRSLGLIGALALVSAPRLARADEDPKMLARRHFDRGMELARKGAYAEALAEFTRANEMSPHYAVLYNIGQACIALGRPVEALEALERYLSEGGAEIPAARRSQVENEIAKLGARTAEVEVEVDAPGAIVSIDGKEVGRVPLPGPVRVGIGTHRLRASLEGRPAVEQSITVAGQEKRRVTLSLPSRTAVTGPASGAPTTAAPRKPSVVHADEAPGRTQATLGYIAGGLGIGLGVATVAHYVWNKNRYDTWSSRHQELEKNADAADYGQRQAANNELSDSIGRASVVTVGLGIGAGVFFGTGVVLVATAPSASSSRVTQGAAAAWLGVW